MFLLAELRERIRILPQHFSLDTRQAILDELNKQLANKVLIDVGLVIGVHSIVSLNDAIIAPGDGAAHTDVVFRVIVFRPKIGSVINGKIRSCTREGVFITLGFFDDIFIPHPALQHPSRYEEAEQAWIWSYPMADNESHDLYMDIGEPIRFRIVDEVFLEPSPVGPPNIEIYGIQTSVVSTIPQDKREPYKIIASIAESGLGVWSWWSQLGDNAEEAGDEEENGDESGGVEGVEDNDEDDADKKAGIVKGGEDKKVADGKAATEKANKEAGIVKGGEDKKVADAKAATDKANKETGIVKGVDVKNVSDAKAGTGNADKETGIAKGGDGTDNAKKKTDIVKGVDKKNVDDIKDGTGNVIAAKDNAGKDNAGKVIGDNDKAGGAKDNDNKDAVAKPILESVLKVSGVANTKIDGQNLILYSYFRPLNSY